MNTHKLLSRSALALASPFLMRMTWAACGVGTSGGATDYLQQALCELCLQIQGLIPVAAMLLTITAGVVYTAGQFAGAETRARANVWATSCLTGAIIGIIISQMAPGILSVMAGADISCTP